jgi:protein O-GlcNAc transferase
MLDSQPYSQDSPWINLLNQAIALHRRGELDAAKRIYEQILQSDSRNFEVLHLLGVIALQQKDFPSAVKFITQALEINSKISGAFNNLGAAYKEQSRYVEALECFNRALELDSLSADALSNIGNVYSEQKNWDRAMDYYNRAIAVNAHHADAYYNRGNIYLHCYKYSTAVSDYSKALEFDSGIVEAYLNRGQAYKKMGNYPAAIADFSQVIKMKPASAEAYYHRAVSLLATHDQGLFAIEDLKKAATIKPELQYLQSALFFNKKAFADWDDLEILGDQLLNKSTLGEKAITPFAFISHYDSLHQQLKVTQTWISSQIENDAARLSLFQKHPKSAKIHIGYFSSDFTEHPVSTTLAGLFRNHDKNKFKVTGFYFGRHKDAVLERVAGFFDEFYYIADLSDNEVTELARRLKIDIAVDLNGCTAGSRPRIFLNRAAPTQVNYLGYPGTMGTSLIDYIIADEVVVPAESQKYYTEKIAYMDCFMAHDDHSMISTKKFSKRELGLPEEGFVFCNFSSSYKITSRVWDLWMNILNSTSNSVLWLSCRNDRTSGNLLKEARARGVDTSRIIFAPRFNDFSEHLARLQYADLFLDTYPYNAHSTASAALWAGLPVLTKSGESFASRVAASLLSACKLSELIVRTDEEYQSKAIDLANEPSKILDIKRRISEFRSKNPLFATKNYTRKLENLLYQMYENNHRGHIAGNLKLKSSL